MPLLGDEQPLAARGQNRQHADELVRSSQGQIERLRAGKGVRAEPGRHAIGVHPARDPLVGPMIGTVDTRRVRIGYGPAGIGYQHHSLRLEHACHVLHGDHHHLVQPAGAR